MRVHVVQDSEGRIIGTAPSGVEEVKTSLPGAPLAHTRQKEGKGADEDEETLEVTVVVEAMPDQSVHEVDLPSELENLEEADLANVLLRYRVASGEAKLVERGKPKKR